MAYQKQTWVDGVTPLDAEHMNHMEQGISQLSEEIVTTSESKVAAHNTGADTHSDIRLLIQGLTDRLNALANSDDTTLDQLSEIVAYIKSNRSLIEAITTSKVSVADIIDNLTSNVTNKPLSAAQGVALKALIDSIAVPDKLPNPNALTFTGAVTGTYDGSAPLSVKIPEGGSGEAWELIDSVTLSEDVMSVKFDFDTPYKKILFVCQPNVSVSGWKYFSINNGTGIPCANVDISSTHALFIEIGASEKRRYQAKDSRVFARVRMTVEQIDKPENGTLDTYDGYLWLDVASVYFGSKSAMEINSIAMNTATMCVAGAYFEVWGVKA